MVSTATAASTIDAEAFNQLVLERGLATWETAGYVYCGFRGPNGWELFRTGAPVAWDQVPISVGSAARPAAGSSWPSVTVPTNKRWLLLGGSGTITTDANVADRRAYLSTRMDGTNYNVVCYSSIVIAASQTTVRISATPGTGASGVGTSAAGFGFGIGPNGCELKAGAIWQLGIDGIQAGDRPDGAFYYAYKEVSV